MRLHRIPIWPIVLASLLVACCAAYLWVGAISTASLRFGECGPADGSSSDPYCLVASDLHQQSLLVLGVAALFAVAAVGLKIHRRKARSGGA